MIVSLTGLRVATRFMEDRMARRFTMPREFHLPKDYREKPSIKPPGTDLEIWTWFDPEAAQGKGKFFGIAFQGRANKPLWYYSYSTREGLWKQINESIAYRKKTLQNKLEERERRRNQVPDVKEGDIFYSSWGYDQTNVDFYQVIAFKGKTVVVRPIGKRLQKSNQSADYVVPAPNSFTGPPSKKRIQGEGRNLYFKVEHNNASLWDGKPKYQTAFGWGH